jgi:hypothetical protein
VAANDAGAASQRKEETLKALAEQQASLLKEGAGGDDERVILLEAETMIADLDKELSAVASETATADYKTAVHTLITSMCDLAVQFAARQKRQVPTRPRRGAMHGRGPTSAKQPANV